MTSSAFILPITWLVAGRGKGIGSEQLKGEVNMKLGTIKTAYLLSRIVDDRIGSLDIQNPLFTCAVDRISKSMGCNSNLSDCIRRCKHRLVEPVLWHWEDTDCKIVFGFSREEILDMIG